MPDSNYVIGIDLGTTNSALSYVILDEAVAARKRIRVFDIAQSTGPGEISALGLLPSFLYLPGEHDMPRDAVRLPWGSPSQGFVGALARDQGARVPKRLVQSAKSWLCHGRVDRKAPILPWGVGEDLPKVSPVTATAAYLRHLREAWNHARGDLEEDYLENQPVVITVPASFDEVARDLTLEAAQEAGIPKVTLLEEPLAAFYTWLDHHAADWADYVNPGELILVCDVGGGTTDFTLISLRETGGQPVFERIAVGDHLILGGDNIDLTLARRLEGRLRKGKGRSLDLHAWQGLCAQCRRAKEDILSGREERHRITLVGEGRRLIADTLSADVTLEEINAVILEGFFPLVDPTEDLSRENRKGITEFGLPYAQDPAITRQMIRFLERHRADVQGKLGRESVRPDLVLFNGGTLKPESIRHRLRDALGHYFSEGGGTASGDGVGVLDNPDLDKAVALGASYYGLVRLGRGVKVSSGSPRAYFLGVGRAGAGDRETAICLVERGTEEGHQIALEDRKFQVLTNQPVTFDLYSSSYRSGDKAGDLIEVDDTLTPLPPIRTVIRFGKRAKRTRVPIHVDAHYTEVGTLSLWCRSEETDHRWQLQFQLRDRDQPAPVSEDQVFEESIVEEVMGRVRSVFSGDGRREDADALVNTICMMVDRPKEKWPLTFLRRVADELLALEGARSLAPELEARWLNLTGFCMRPGFGDALDEHRLKQVWKLHHLGPVHGRAVQVRCEWWIFWRRVAAGLTVNQQKRISQEISLYLKPKKGKEKRKPSPQEFLEIWMALANLERISGPEKAEYGGLLLEGLHPKRAKSQNWWTLARLGARELLYGPLDKVVPAAEVSRWVEKILSIPWRNPRPAAGALSQLTRLTGDRTRDVPTALREGVIGWMEKVEGADAYLRILREVIPRDSKEEHTVFGESLPAGIVLHTERND